MLETSLDVSIIIPMASLSEYHLLVGNSWFNQTTGQVHTTIRLQQSVMPYRLRCLDNILSVLMINQFRQCYSTLGSHYNESNEHVNLADLYPDGGLYICLSLLPLQSKRYRRQWQVWSTSIVSPARGTTNSCFL